MKERNDISPFHHTPFSFLQQPLQIATLVQESRTLFDIFWNNKPQNNRVPGTKGPGDRTEFLLTFKFFPKGKIDDERKKQYFIFSSHLISSPTAAPANHNTPIQERKTIHCSTLFGTNEPKKQWSPSGRKGPGDRQEFIYT